MRFGAHTFGFVWQSDPEAAFAAIAGQGFRAVQLMASPPHFDPWAADPDRTVRLRAALERNGLTLLAADLASSDVNLASPSADVVAFSVDAYRRTIRRCAELGAPFVCVASGRRHALLASANLRLMDTFRPAFGAIVRAAREAGIRVILENHPQGLLADAATIVAFLSDEGHADVPVIYDVANAFAIGEDPVAGLRILADRTGIVHLSDSPVGQWRHDPIGSGAIDFAAIGRHLAGTGFAGHVVLEILSGTPAADLGEGMRRLARAGWPAGDSAQPSGSPT